MLKDEWSHLEEQLREVEETNTLRVGGDDIRENEDNMDTMQNPDQLEVVREEEHPFVADNSMDAILESPHVTMRKRRRTLDSQRDNQPNRDECNERMALVMNSPFITRRRNTDGFEDERDEEEEGEGEPVGRHPNREEEEETDSVVPETQFGSEISNVFVGMEERDRMKVMKSKKPRMKRMRMTQFPHGLLAQLAFPRFSHPIGKLINDKNYSPKRYMAIGLDRDDFDWINAKFMMSRFQYPTDACRYLWDPLEFDIDHQKKKHNKKKPRNARRKWVLHFTLDAEADAVKLDRYLAKRHVLGVNWWNLFNCKAIRNGAPFFWCGVQYKSDLLRMMIYATHFVTNMVKKVLAKIPFAATMMLEIQKKMMHSKNRSLIFIPSNS